MLTERMLICRGRGSADELVTTCRDGNQYVYGYVPIVVAKCGMMLKETGESALLAAELL